MFRSDRGDEATYRLDNVNDVLYASSETLYNQPLIGIS